MKFNILVNNGFRYDFKMTIEAKNSHAAREWFKKEYAGSYETKDFKVKAVK